MFVAIIVYFFLIYGYFELVNTIHTHLRDRGIYVEFGHASILLILLFLVSVITGIVFAILVVAKSKRAKHANHS